MDMELPSDMQNLLQLLKRNSQNQGDADASA